MRGAQRDDDKTFATEFGRRRARKDGVTYNKL